MVRKTSFRDATKVEAIGSHTYSANFPDDWCIGSVPHGGFITSTFMRVASLHFSTTLSACKQPHTIALHLDFLRRTETGPAVFTVKDLKIGRQTSVIHVSLSQGPANKPREEVVGYITRSNIDTEEGPTFSTDYKIHPAPLPTDLSKLKSGTDDNWAEQKEVPFPEFRKASLQVRFFFPRAGFASVGARAMADEWITLNTVDSTEKFTNESLGYVVDAWPQLIETYRNDESYHVTGKTKKAGLFWYPTLLLNLDVKKALPEEGVDWLWVRVRSKTIKNGRYDLEVIVLDESGDVVALSHHVALAVPAARNLAKRSNAEPKL